MNIPKAGYVVSGILLIAAQLSSSAPRGASDQEAGPAVQRGPMVIWGLHDDTPLPLREMHLLSAEIPPERRAPRVWPFRGRPAQPVASSEPWPSILPSAMNAAPVASILGPLSPSPSIFQFAGVSNADNAAGSVWPPDANVAVGATQVVQTVNTSYKVFYKSGKLELGPGEIYTLWNAFAGSPCMFDSMNPNQVYGDPVVLYDKMAGRWLVTQVESSDHGITGSECIGVSFTSDATGSYHRYSYSFGDTCGNSQCLNDYPKFGVWADAYYASYNMFIPNGFGGEAFVGAQVVAYDRNAMLAGSPAAMNVFQRSTSDFGLLPSDLDGSNPPPAGEPNFFIERPPESCLGPPSSAPDGCWSTACTTCPGCLYLYTFHADFTPQNTSSFTGPIGIPTFIAGYCKACRPFTDDPCILQPGSAALDSIGDRLMHRLSYRHFNDHESLVASQTVSTYDGNGVMPDTNPGWAEFRISNGLPMVYQDGKYNPDANLTYRWMGSIAMDGAGNIALGYSKSSSSVYPSIAFTYRTPGDSLGTLRAEAIITAGTGAQSPLPDSVCPPTLPPSERAVCQGRWGDYTSMAVDPVDDSTFVYTNEYYKVTGTAWSTQIASFSFQPGAGSVPDRGSVGTPVTAAPATGGNVSLSWGASCNTSDPDYEVYEGTLARTPGQAFAYNHAGSRMCSTSGATSITFTPVTTSCSPSTSACGDYYLVVPKNTVHQEGSYGHDGSGAELPQGSPTCSWQNIACS